MQRVNMHEAKTNLSRLVASAEAGETIEIMRAGKVVAILRGVSGRKRELGAHPELAPPPDWDSDALNASIARDVLAR